MSVFCPRSGYKLSRGGGGKKWQNSVHVFVEFVGLIRYGSLNIWKYHDIFIFLEYQ